MNQFSLSVIIPMFNSENTIKHCIDALFSELSRCSSLIEWEILIINDGSTDESLSIVNGYSDSRILLISQPQQGPSAARNAGVQHSRHPYLLFIDSDVVLSKDAIINLLITKSKHPTVIGINGFPEPSIPKGDWTTQYVNSSLIYQLQKHGTLVNTCFTSCCLLDKSAWESMGGWDDKRTSRYSDDVQSRWHLPKHSIRQETSVRFIHLKYVQPWGLIKHRFNLGFHFLASIPPIYKRKAGSVLLNRRYPLNIILSMSVMLLLILRFSLDFVSPILIIMLCAFLWTNQDFLRFYAKTSRQQSIPKRILDGCLLYIFSFGEGLSMGLGILCSFTNKPVNQIKKSQ